ncbi:MAG: glycoside hydrolase [Ruminococcus sp.]|nr:glycoside hydrolase [Ruminococcus sp.]
MKSLKKVTALLCLAAIAGTSIFSASSALKSTEKQAVYAAADDGNDDWLHAKGSRLYDKNGNEVWLTGANWFGFNCTENCAHGLYACDVDEFLSSCADHGINVIRFPISTELIVSWMNGEPYEANSVQAGYEPPYVDINKDFVYEDGKTLKNSMEIFDVIMQKCKVYGIKAFIDIHSPDANNSGHNYELWYGKAGVSTDVWIESLTWLADKYKDDDTLIGYDLKNEPHGKRGYSGTSCPDDIAKWDDSTDENNWAYAATKCADSILAVNPNALIFIEGIEQYPKDGKSWGTPDIFNAPPGQSPWYGAWWGGNLRGVRDLPITPKSGTSQIVYSPHDYGPSVYAQTWFDKDFTTQTLLDDYWYDTWAYINAEDIAPLLIGEWGGHMDDGPNQKWMTLLRDYMIDNHINHTFWCLNPNSGDTGGLLSYDFKTWDKDKYGLFEPSLWQTAKSGKYIGLDHQIPLGKNGTGLSLNEYYSSYSSTEGSNLDGGKTSSGNPVVTDTPKVTEPVVTTAKVTEPAVTTAKVTEPVVTTTAPKVTTAPPDASDAYYGDLDHNGKVDITDLSLLSQYLLKEIEFDADDTIRADVTGDSKVNMSDLAHLKRYVVKLTNILGPRK